MPCTWTDLLERLSICGQTPRVAVALGVFDGVHVGHQAILSELTGAAEETNAVPVALFFSPHPRDVLFPPGPKYLTSPECKSELLCRYGAEYSAVVEFDRELASLDAEEFLERYFLSCGAEVTAFCVGSNWRFGRGNAAGTVELEKWAAAHGRQARIVSCVELGGETVSSTRIRAMIEKGDLDTAALLLGRDFAVSGTVVHGNGIGRRIDCATANIVDDRHILPPEGVYAADAELDGRRIRGIVYVGKAPTIRGDSGPPWVELHLFDIEEDLYGKFLSVSFLRFIRPSIRFSSPEELGRQIQLDIAAARAL